jgi:2-dehydro-3-deoxygluconokinase
MNIICFGEILMRLTPPAMTRLAQATSFDVHFGGAEANVAASLAQFGAQAVLVSKLPHNPLGEAALRFFRSHGVDVRHIHRSADAQARLGVYYLEQGAGLRPSQVVYDRTFSAMSVMEPNEWNWEELLRGGDWFHWTGITAALGAGVRAELQRALEAAKNMGLTVSCDLNYRQKLWSPEEARSAMTALMQYTDVCISNEHDARICLDVQMPNAETREAFYRDIAASMKQTFGFQTVALSVRTSDAEAVPEVMHRRAFLLDGKESKNGYFSQTLTYRPVEHIGGGDAFTAGLIYGLLAECHSRDALEFAVAAAALKQTVGGDANCVSVDEVRAVVNHASLPKVQR